MNINKVTVCGRLGADPEVKTLPDGRCVASLSIATNEKWKDKQGNQQERTEWHRVSFFGKAAEIISQYSVKGSVLYVEGKLQTRKWTDQQGIDRWSTQIIGDQFQFGPRPQGASQQQAGFGAGAQEEAGYPPPAFNADWVPF